MIKIKIEIIPFLRGEEETMATGIIKNNGTGSKTNGNYSFIFYNKAGSVWKAGKFHGFKHTRYIVWRLIYLCLKKTLENKNKK